METSSRSQTIWHECGHVLMAITLGARVDHVTIESEEHSALLEGKTQVVWPLDSFSEKQIALHEIKIALAGPVVEMIVDRNQFNPEFLDAWRPDWEMAVERAKAHLNGSLSISKHLGTIVFELMEFFERDDVWAALGALTDELDAFERLESEEIEEVLDTWPIG